MRIAGSLFIAIALAWLIVTQVAASLPKAANYSRRIQKLPVQASYSHDQVRDIIWEVSAFRWSFPDQATYSAEQVSNIVMTASMNNKPARDGTAPPVFGPVLLLVIGAFLLGVGIGYSKDVKQTT
ncbi:MAG TPA: hypothetical protein VFV96_00945 [Verrucomicrobiae bacterium]|nr:hypothetical protein [Verrucomicrobiae bacterium]